MLIDIISIFPEYLAPLNLSLIGKAQAEGRITIRNHNLRDWTTDRHRTVDDTPVGGGAGMVMKPDVWGSALDDVLGFGPGVVPAPTSEPGQSAGTQGDEVPEAERVFLEHRNEQADRLAKPASCTLIIPTPSGARFTQGDAQRLAGANHLVFACGRYEGIDARVADHYRTRGEQVSEFSIGDYVLNGGEVAALVMIEAIVRLVPGVLGNPESLVEESHADGLLEYPAYTRPMDWRGLEVPAVLRSGNHAQIARWRRGEALIRTAHRRPDLLQQLDPAALTRADRDILRGLGWAEVGGELRLVAE